MFPSQASYTFNPLLPFTLSVSVPYISFDVLASFSETPILQRVVEFISPSHSSSTIFKPTARTNIHLTQGDDSQRVDRISAQYSFDSLEDTVSRLIGDYRRLYSVVQDLNNSKNPQGFDFPQKAHIFAEIKQFKRRVLNMLCRLAALTLEHPQEPLVNHVYMIYSALTSSSTFRASLQEHQSLNIYEIVTAFFNIPMTLENSLYMNYINNKSAKCEEEHKKSAKILSIRCPAAKNLVCNTSSDLIEMLETKKMISCPEEDIEEESETHERSSTTSASSRTNPCEVDLPQTYNVFGGSPQSNKTASASKEKDMSETTSLHEIYDGCFFSDLTITFNPTDKLLFQIEESNDKEANGHRAWRKNSYNYNNNINTKYNYSKTPAFIPNQNPYPTFNPRIEDPMWKGNSVPTFDPSLLKTPPTTEQKIIPLNLFTLPQGTLMPTTGFNVFKPGNVIIPGPAQQINTPPSFNNKRVPATVEAPRTVQPGLLDQRARDKSWESHSSIQSDQQQLKTNKIAAATVSKASNPTNAPKNLHTQTNKNGNAGKKPSSQNAKKKQEKGGFKLWDMISVQGKLKNF